MEAMEGGAIRDTYRFDSRAAGLELGLIVALAGCGGAVNDDPTRPGSAPESIAATVSIQGTAQAPDGRPVAGVAVCLRAAPLVSASSCTTSSREGSWRIAGVPANTLVAITFIKSGFFPTLRPIATSTSDITIPAGDGTLVAPGDPAAVLVSALESPAAPDGTMGRSIDPDVGHVAFATATAGAQPTAAAMVAIVPFSGTRTTGLAPLYVDANGDLVDESSGSRGLFVNLQPGLYLVSFSGASAACSYGGGLCGAPFPASPEARPGTIVPVVAGFLTTPVAAACQ